MTEPQDPKFDAEGEDARLLANWLAGPGARSTDEDRERIKRWSREGRIPRRKTRPTSNAHMDDLVEKWHTSTGTDDLPTFCGLTREEYVAWVEGRLDFDVLPHVRRIGRAGEGESPD